MLPLLFLLAAQPLSTDVPAEPTHVERIEHRGTHYAVTYRPLIHTTARTIGVNAGARAAPQRCRAVTEIAVEREVRLADGSAPLAHRLAGTRRTTAYHFGPCEQNRRTLAAAQDRQAQALAAELRTLAAADRPALLAQLDAARALAVN